MAYKPKPIKTTVGGAIADAFAEIQTLAEEMRETADNMDNANMGHMPKAEAASEAADSLEQLDEPEVPDGLAGIEVSSTEMVNKDKRKGTSRDMRFSNAKSLLEDAKSALEELEPEGHDDDEENEVSKAAKALKEEAENLANELDEAVGTDVDFPGMYG